MTSVAPAALWPSTALMVSVLLLAKITSSRPVPGTIVPWPAVVLSEAAAALVPNRMPPVPMVRV